MNLKIIDLHLFFVIGKISDVKQWRINKRQKENNRDK